MNDINMILSPADVTRLEIAISGQRDKCDDNLNAMRQTKLHYMQNREWCLAYESEYTTHYEKEIAKRQQWDDLLSTVKEARGGAANPFLSY